MKDKTKEEEEEEDSDGKTDARGIDISDEDLKDALWSIVGDGKVNELKKFLKKYEAIDLPINEENYYFDEDGGHVLMHCVKEGCDRGPAFGRDHIQCLRLLADLDADVNHQDKAGRTAMHWAIFHKNTNLVAELNRLGVHPHLRDQDGIDCVHLCIQLGAKECFKRLAKNCDGEVREGEFFDQKDGKGVPPLVAAVQFGNLEICRQLLEYGADVNLCDRKFRRSPLHHAILKERIDIYDLLLKYQPDLDIGDIRGKNVFHRVCASKDIRYFHKLLKTYGEIPESIMDQSAIDGVTPVISACQNGNPEQLKELLDKGISASEVDNSGKTALHYCADNLETQCAEMILHKDKSLLNKKDDQGFTPLHMAVIGGNAPLLKLLLKKGADINCLDNERHTVAHWATVCGHLEVLDILLDNGADVSKADSHDAYPIHYAAQMNGKENGHSDHKIGEKVLKKLLDNGVPYNVLDKDGRPPLLWAASAGNYESCKLLVKAGAEINATDKDGLSAIHCAASRGHVKCVEVLKNLGGDVDMADKNNCTPMFYAITLGNKECSKELLKFGANPNHQDNRGRTPTHCAAIKGCIDTVKMLDKYSAQMWTSSSRGDCPIHEASQGGFCDVVKFLLRWKNDPEAVNRPNKNGRTCLHIAAIVNNLPLCKLLIDNGADKNAKMNHKDKSYTPYDAAIVKGNKETADYIKGKGGNTAAEVTDSNNKEEKRQSKSAKSRRSVITLESTPEDPREEEPDSEEEKKKGDIVLVPIKADKGKNKNVKDGKKGEKEQEEKKDKEKEDDEIVKDAGVKSAAVAVGIKSKNKGDKDKKENEKEKKQKIKDEEEQDEDGAQVDKTAALAGAGVGIKKKGSEKEDDKVKDEESKKEEEVTPKKAKDKGDKEELEGEDKQVAAAVAIKTKRRGDKDGKQVSGEKTKEADAQKVDKAEKGKQITGDKEDNKEEEEEVDQSAARLDASVNLGVRHKRKKETGDKEEKEEEDKEKEGKEDSKNVQEIESSDDNDKEKSEKGKKPAVVVKRKRSEDTKDSETEKEKIRKDEERKKKEAEAKAEKDRLEKERKEKVEREKAEREKAEKEKVEREKAEREKAEKEKAEKAEKEKAEKEKAEKEKAEKEKAEKEKAEKEKAEREKAAKEKAERERAEKEQKKKEISTKREPLKSAVAKEFERQSAKQTAPVAGSAAALAIKKNRKEDFDRQKGDEIEKGDLKETGIQTDREKEEKPITVQRGIQTEKKEKQAVTVQKGSQTDISNKEINRSREASLRRKTRSVSRDRESDREFEVPDGSPESEAALLAAAALAQEKGRSESDSDEESKPVSRRRTVASPVKVKSDGKIHQGLLTKSQRQPVSRQRTAEQRSPSPEDSDEEDIDDRDYIDSTANKPRSRKDRAHTKLQSRAHKSRNNAGGFSMPVSVHKEIRDRKRARERERQRERERERENTRVTTLYDMDQSLEISDLESTLTRSKLRGRASESIQESVRRYQDQRRMVRQLHQLKRAQIYTGPMHDVVLFSKLMDVYKNSAPGEDESTLDSQVLEDWEGYLKDQLRFVSHFYEDDRTDLRKAARNHQHRLENSANSSKRNHDEKVQELQQREELETREREEMEERLKLMAKKTDDSLAGVQNNAAVSLQEAKKINEELQKNFQHASRERLKSGTSSKKEYQWLINEAREDEVKSRAMTADKERRDKHREWHRKKDDELRRRLMKVYGPSQELFDKPSKQKMLTPSKNSPRNVYHSTPRPRSTYTSTSGGMSSQPNYDREITVQMTEYGMRRVKQDDYDFGKISRVRMRAWSADMSSANWTPKFDGSVRPRAGLVYVEPDVYNEVLREEKRMRKSYFNAARSGTVDLSVAGDAPFLSPVGS